MVGLGSYLVNVAADCNGCHSAGPPTAWCCDVVGIPPNSGVGNPYLLSPPFSGTKQVNPKKYLGGGRDFGALSSSGLHIFSRNLTPDKNGVPEGGRSLSDFKQIMRSGVDLDQRHLSCSATITNNCLTFPFNGALLQVMPWPNFQNMTDRQLTAIYTFLSSIRCLEGGPGEPKNRCK